MPSEKLPVQLTTEIMTRDDATCVYCGASGAKGAVLSVDHLLARSWGGSNEWKNLVTCCRPCNDSKGNMDEIAFAGMIDRHKGSLPALQERFGATTGAEILARVEAARKRPIDQAKVALAIAALREALRAARRG